MALLLPAKPFFVREVRSVQNNGLLYTILLSSRAQKDLRKLAARQRDRLVAQIQALADDPFPPGRKKLKGMRGDYWRVRVGDYRILYEVEQDELVVLILRALDRKEAY